MKYFWTEELRVQKHWESLRITNWTIFRKKSMKIFDTHLSSDLLSRDLPPLSLLTAASRHEEKRRWSTPSTIIVTTALTQQPTWASHRAGVHSIHKHRSVDCRRRIDDRSTVAAIITQLSWHLAAAESIENTLVCVKIVTLISTGSLRMASKRTQCDSRESAMQQQC